MKQLSPLRSFIYLLLLGMVPLVLVIWEYHERKEELDQLEEQLQLKLTSTLRQAGQQTLNRLVSEHFKYASPHYIDHGLEKLDFLASEIEELKQLSTENINYTLKNRLEFLTKGGNTLKFMEGSVESFPSYRESIESLSHPVEVDGWDLKRLLSHLDQIESEELTLQPPQIIVTEFKLEKKRQNGVNEVFKLDVKLLKREFK